MSAPRRRRFVGRLVGSPPPGQRVEARLCPAEAPCAANAASFSEGVASHCSFACPCLGFGAARAWQAAATARQHVATGGGGNGEGGGTEQQAVRGVDVTAGSSLLRRAFWAAAASRFSWRRLRRAAGVTAEKSFAFAPPMCARTARDARRTGGVACFKGVICSTFTRFSFASRNSRWPNETRFFELRRARRGLLASLSS